MEIDGEIDKCSRRKRHLVDKKHGLRWVPDSYKERPLKRARTIPPGAAKRKENASCLNLNQACLDTSAEGKSNMPKQIVNKIDSILAESRAGGDTQPMLKTVESFLFTLKAMIAGGKISIPGIAHQKEEMEVQLKASIEKKGSADSKATLLRADISALEKEKELWLELQQSMSSCALGSVSSDTQDKDQVPDKTGNQTISNTSGSGINGVELLTSAAHEMWHNNSKKDQVLQALHKKLDEAVKMQESLLALHSEEFFAMLPGNRDPKQAIKTFLGFGAP